MCAKEARVPRPPARTVHPLAATLVAMVAVAGVLIGMAVAPAAAGAMPVRAGGKKIATVMPVPHVVRRLPVAIEAVSVDYVAQDSCAPAFKPGTRKLIHLLARTYPDISAQGSYACGTDGPVSEHYEGRAIDWMASVRNRKQHREAIALIKWLRAPDRRGNKFAMARRLGVMYLIYNNRIWGAWDGKWEPYGSCATTRAPAYDNACHRTHVHISLTWNGAMGRTSFWKGKPRPTDYGPCRTAGLKWAGKHSHRNLRPCAGTPGPKLPHWASPALKRLVHYSGAYLRGGSSGPAVGAVQQALAVPATATFGHRTKRAVRDFQHHHRLPKTGAMNIRTWLRLVTVATRRDTAAHRKRRARRAHTTARHPGRSRSSSRVGRRAGESRRNR
jgi:hypothetical protein